MRSRGGRRASKKVKSLGRFITQQLTPLEGTAIWLNDGATDEIRDMAEQLVVDYPRVSRAVADRFTAFASPAPMTYRLLPRPDSMPPLPPRDAQGPVSSVREWGRGFVIYVDSPSNNVHGVIALSSLLGSPHRQRLRRCEKCRRFFVDWTRNRSARRCSRECTIAFSNAQRGRTGRKP
jgi:hypothetical protein